MTFVVKHLVYALQAAGLAVLLGSAASSTPSIDTSSMLLWQIGRIDEATAAIAGATEFPATGGFWPEFEYSVGSDADPVGAPSCPGYLHTVNVCAVDPSRACTDTARRLVIRFDTQRSYLEGALRLDYGRYGAETDSLYVDGMPLGTAVSETNVFALLEYWLPALPAGQHRIEIQYIPSADDTGHYIDFISLYEEVPVGAEPSTWGRVKSLYAE